MARDGQVVSGWMRDAGGFLLLMLACCLAAWLGVAGAKRWAVDWSRAPKPVFAAGARVALAPAAPIDGLAILAGRSQKDLRNALFSRENGISIGPDMRSGKIFQPAAGGEWEVVREDLELTLVRDALSGEAFWIETRMLAPWR